MDWNRVFSPVHCERHRNHHCVLAMLAAPLLLRLALLGESRTTGDIPGAMQVLWLLWISLAVLEMEQSHFPIWTSHIFLAPTSINSWIMRSNTQYGLLLFHIKGIKRKGFQLWLKKGKTWNRSKLYGFKSRSVALVLFGAHIFRSHTSRRGFWVSFFNYLWHLGKTSAPTAPGGKTAVLHRLFGSIPCHDHHVPICTQSTNHFATPRRSAEE